VPSPRAVAAVLAAVSLVFTSGCLGGPNGGGPLFPPVSVTVFAIDASVEADPNNTSAHPWGVRVVNFGWCAAASLGDGGATVAVWADGYDRATTSIVIVSYTGPLRLQSHEGATMAYFLHAGEKATVNASLNSSHAIYRFNPVGTGTFEPAGALASANGSSLRADYAVATTADSPAQVQGLGNGTYAIHERHTAAPPTSAQVVSRGMCM
jgi:hypothetical protein